MLQAFQLTFRALLRGRILVLLILALGLVHIFAPGLVRSDGTVNGTFEMWIRAVSGSANLVVLLTILVVSCGLFAQEREEKRLALTLVRPVTTFQIALGRWLGVLSIAALALAATALLTAFSLPVRPLPNCQHHYAPTLPPAAEVASHILDSYLADPETPEAVRKASRSSVLTLLTTKEIDRYDVIHPGATMAWPCNAATLRKAIERGEDLTLAVRFATAFEMRTAVMGTFTLDAYTAVISNTTQSVLTIPFMRKAGAPPSTCSKLDLTFTNTGKSAIMIRPRRDLEVCAQGDAFVGNLIRAHLETLLLAALLAAYGLFLSASLSRPVAIFTALTTYAIVLMAPSVIVQFPDEFNAPLADRLGLMLARGVSYVTANLAEPEPISDLATNRAIEYRAIVRLVLSNAILLPTILLTLTAFILRRKPSERA